MKKNRKKYKDSILLWDYGIDTNFYNETLKLQNESCSICKLHKSNFNYSLFIDHCNKTGNFRGLLCRNCNSGIGYFKDNIEIMNSAISYLQKFNKNVN